MAAPWEVVLVTGGSGFLGQHIVKLLQEQDSAVKEIRVLDLQPYVNKLGHEEYKPLHSFVGDICDVEQSREAFRGVHCVIHCAALVSYHFPPDTANLRETNVTDTAVFYGDDGIGTNGKETIVALIKAQPQHLPVVKMGNHGKPSSGGSNTLSSPESKLIGTQVVISLCLEQNVSRLVFCSSIEVTLVPYLRGTFSVIVNQTESKALPPDDENFLVIPGYAASKLRAERLVLAADCRGLVNGTGYLRTVALRPTLLYGEQDPHLVPALIRLAEANDGRLIKFAGAGGKQQVTYAGNAAWAHLRAKDLLLQRPSEVGGLPVFITDDTPACDLLHFAQRVTSSVDAPPRCLLTRCYVPSLLAYLTALILELIASLLRLRLPFPPRAVVSYLGSILYYNRLRAAVLLEYSPIFSLDESNRRARKYYTSDDV